MPRRSTHKFAVQTKGLTTEQACQLAYIISCAARAFVTAKDEYEFGTNVKVADLRRAFPSPECEWFVISAADRRSLV